MEKTTAIRTIITNMYKNKEFWYGVRRENAKKPIKPFKFIDGSDIKKTYWNKGEPNNRRKNEFCVYHKTNNNWDDQACDWKRGFLCQRSKFITGELSLSKKVV